MATFCALNAGLLAQTQYLSMLNYSVMQITNKRQNIAYLTLQLAGADTEDPRFAQLQAQDNYLEIQQKNLETQIQTASAQVKALEKIVQQNSKEACTINFSA